MFDDLYRTERIIWIIVLCIIFPVGIAYFTIRMLKASDYGKEVGGIIFAIAVLVLVVVAVLRVGEFISLGWNTLVFAITGFVAAIGGWVRFTYDEVEDTGP